MKTQTHTFRIYVSEEDRIPQSHQIDGILKYCDTISARGSNGQRGLWILTAQTVLLKFTGSKTPNEMARRTLPPCTKFINSLFDSAGRETLDSSNWLYDLFGFNPKDSFFRSASPNKEKHVWFDEAVEPSLFWIDLTGKTRKCNRNDVIALRNEWSSNRSILNPRRFTPSVHVYPEGESRFVIERYNKLGSLSIECEISLQVESSYQTQLCIFWLDSDATLFCLYPFPHEDLHIKASRKKKVGDGFKLTIPEKELLDITTGKGTETCLILERKKRFSKADVTRIETDLKNALQKSNKGRFVNAPKYRRRTLPLEESELLEKSATRLGKPQKRSDWEIEICRHINNKANSIHFFHIPNTRP